MCSALGTRQASYKDSLRQAVSSHQSWEHVGVEMETIKDGS